MVGKQQRFGLFFSAKTQKCLLRPRSGPFFRGFRGRFAEFGLNWGCIGQKPTPRMGKSALQQISRKDGDLVEGYCLKDKRKVEMKDPQPITMKNGKPATVGTCPFCGTKIYKIGKATV